MLKRCTKCGQEKPMDADHFYKNTQQSCGFCPSCIVCIKSRMAKKYAEDPLYREKKKAEATAWRTANPDQKKQNDHTRYWADPVKSRADKRADYVRHKASRNAEHRKRYATDPVYREKELASSRRWALLHSEQKKETDRQYAKKHSADVVARMAIWKKEHPEKLKEHSRAYHLRHPEQAKARKIRRRARESKLPATITKEDLAVIAKQHRGICYICRTSPFTEWDHVVPVKHGGPSTKENLRPACRICNRAKGPKLLLRDVTLRTPMKGIFFPEISYSNESLDG